MLVTLDTSPPQVDSLSVSSDVVGNSGTITVSGSHLIDDFHQSTSNITGTGMTLSNTRVGGSSSSVLVDYTIDANASSGDRQISVTTTFGTSNSKPFTVGYPPAPSIVVAPPVWLAGQTTSVTITGQGFGTYPTVVFAGVGVPTTPFSGASSGKIINIDVPVDANAPTGPVGITVTPGYPGNSYICGSCSGGQTGTGQGSATVQAALLPSPSIIIGTDGSQCNSSNAQDISGSTQQVSIGQRIAFTACIPADVQGASSGSWTPDSPDSTSALGNFTVGTTPDFKESIVAVSKSACTSPTSCLFQPFYFVTPGITEQFTFTYTVGARSASATVTFVTNGPQGVKMTTRLGEPIQQYRLNGSDVVGLGNATDNSQSGIFFSHDSGTSPNPSGAYEYVQVVTYVGLGAITPEPRGRVDPIDDPDDDGLDTTFPYSRDSVTGDAPYVRLSSNFGEISFTFKAKMFLLWTPQADPQCTVGAACGIPVPVASAAWGFTVDDINTLDRSSPSTYHGWVVQPCSRSLDVIYSSLSRSSDYPTWTQPAK